jgi:hypothetical protein
MSNPSPRESRHDLVSDIRNDLDVFVDCIQAEEYGDAMSALRHISLQFLRLRYDYRGDADRASQFIAANNPALTELHWLIDHLAQTCRAGTAPEAYWDGLALLAAWAIIHAWRTT